MSKTIVGELMAGLLIILGFIILVHFSKIGIAMSIPRNFVNSVIDT